MNPDPFLLESCMIKKTVPPKMMNWLIVNMVTKDVLSLAHFNFFCYPNHSLYQIEVSVRIKVILYFIPPLPFFLLID